MLMINQLITH